MNLFAVRAIFVVELARSRRTLLQSIAAPVISTSLYFIVFGSAIGGRMTTIGGVSYGAFIVPGLIMLALLTESVSNASFGIYLPRFTGTIYELLSRRSPFSRCCSAMSAPRRPSPLFLASSSWRPREFFVPFDIVHPVWATAFLVLISVTFSLFGFILGVWADGFEKLQLVPLMILSPLTFLGGTFYSIEMLPPPWRTIALFNPVVYLVNGFRWAFYGIADVAIEFSLGMIVVFMIFCIGVIAWIFRTGYRLRP